MHMPGDLNWAIHHVALRTYNVHQSKDFFEKIVGLNGGRLVTIEVNKAPGWALPELKQIYVYDPAMNVIEIHEIIG
jgi:hypothetical protein